MPEWEGKTIYIDGLDETRAGASDGRTPFDGVRAKLHRLGRPPFRISCRAADWFGSNDRERLSTVAPNREVQVLRLDPLPDHGVLEILERNHDDDDPGAFVAEARERGVEDLLLNPQNLRMLAEAVAEADEWPRTRAETFDMACRKLVSEENPGAPDRVQRHLQHEGSAGRGRRSLCSPAPGWQGWGDSTRNHAGRQSPSSGSSPSWEPPDSSTCGGHQSVSPCLPKAAWLRCTGRWPSSLQRDASRI